MLASFGLFAPATARWGRSPRTGHSVSPLILGHPKVMEAAAVTRQQKVL
jgi:hypothetical protein